MKRQKLCAVLLSFLLTAGSLSSAFSASAIAVETTAVTETTAETTTETTVVTDTTESTETEQTIYTGACGAEGDNVIWTYDATAKTMTFSGTGAIKDYEKAGETPSWLTGENGMTYAAKHVIFEEGITEIPAISEVDGFLDRTTKGVNTVTMPESLTNLELGDSLLAYNKKTVLFYVKAGSYSYYRLIAVNNRYVKVMNDGVAENPVIPAEGEHEDLKWSFDYDTRVMVVSGTENGTFYDSYLFHELSDMLKVATQVIFDKNFTVPRWYLLDSPLPTTYRFFSTLQEYFPADHSLDMEVCSYQGHISTYLYSSFDKDLNELTEAYTEAYPDEENPFSGWVSHMTDPDQTVFTGDCSATEDDNVTWTYNTETRTMTFAGNGAVKNYRTIPVPWREPDCRDYAPLHIVYEEGVTDCGGFYPSELFGDTLETEEVTITLPESMKNFDYLSRDGLVTYQAKAGSSAYYHFIDLLNADGDSKLVITGEAKNPIVEPSGTSGTGLIWDFDYNTRVLTLSGTDARLQKDLSWGSSYYLFKLSTLVKASTKVIFTKDFVVPDDTYQDIYGLNGLNVFVDDISNWIKYHDISVYCYKNSDFDQTYQEAAALVQTYQETKTVLSSLAPIQYIADETDATIYGDINQDGSVNLLDAIYLNKYLAKAVQLTDVQLAASDCDGNGTPAEDTDLTILMQYLTFLVTELPYTE